MHVIEWLGANTKNIEEGKGKSNCSESRIDFKEWYWEQKIINLMHIEIFL